MKKTKKISTYEVPGGMLRLEIENDPEDEQDEDAEELQVWQDPSLPDQDSD